MSIRAHRIVRIERAPYTTFNCWHDNELLEFLLDSGDTFDGLNMKGAGTIDVSVERLQEALDSPDLKLNLDVREAIKNDMAWVETTNDNYITYDCF